MKRNGLSIVSVALVAFVAASVTPVFGQTPLGSAFTYQGRLDVADVPVNDTADFMFSLWDAGMDGNQIADTISFASVVVVDGLFTLDLDFGPGVFNGDELWLEIDVRSPAGGGDFTTLDPRQPLTATPYAQTAAEALIVTGIDGHSLDAADGSPIDAVFVDDAGDVGIGETNPSAALDVVGTTELNGDVLVSGKMGMADSATPANELVIAVADASHSAPFLRIGHTGGFNDPYSGIIAFDENVADSSAVGPDNFCGVALRFNGDTNELEFRGGCGPNINVDTADVLMALNRHGPVGIGTVNPQGALDVAGPFARNFFIGVNDIGHRIIGTDVDGNLNFKPSTDGASVVVRDGNTSKGIKLTGGGANTIQSVDVDGTSPFDLGINPLGGEVGIGTLLPGFTLEVNGTAAKPGGGSWSSSSDRRLKKNIGDLDGALERLLALRGVTFEYKDAAAINERSGTRIGVIAQEVERVVPDWVDVNGRGDKTVTFRGFEALTVEALRELRQEKDQQIESLHAENANLVAENQDIRARLARLEALVERPAAK